MLIVPFFSSHPNDNRFCRKHACMFLIGLTVSFRCPPSLTKSPSFTLTWQKKKYPPFWKQQSRVCRISKEEGWLNIQSRIISFFGKCISLFLTSWDKFSVWTREIFAIVISRYIARRRITFLETSCNLVSYENIFKSSHGELFGNFSSKVLDGWLSLHCLKDTYISVKNMVMRCKTVNFNL